MAAYLLRMKKLRYYDLARNEKALLAHTGLKVQEFELLLPFFDEAWQGFIRYHTLDGKPRARAAKERKNSILPTSADKLLFVLYYLKTNPLQAVLASAFSMHQPHASTWLSRLLPLLETALAKAEALPERQSERLARLVANETRLLLDGTERPVPRSNDKETQREHYSGKKSVTR